MLYCIYGCCLKIVNILQSRMVGDSMCVCVCDEWQISNITEFNRFILFANGPSLMLRCDLFGY